MYIYENPEWPKFRWDQQRLAGSLLLIRHQQGRLLGGMQSIGFPFDEEAMLQSLTQEVVKTSEIEGEFLDQTVVRSSVAQHLGIDIGALAPRDRHVDGVVEMMLDATRKYELALTKERLFNWHAGLFPTGRSGISKIEVAMWRTGSVEVVSGQIGKEDIHFEGPPAERVDHEMQLFLDWINHETAIDLVLKAAISHLWFVSIHPFADGNGRIGRAIGDMMLARSEKSSRRFYSVSAQIQSERKGYYSILEQTQKGNLDVTLWLEWFLGCLERAIDNALTTKDMLLQKAHFWKGFAETPMNERQRKMINMLLTEFEGKLTSSKWAKITKCSQDTAYRDILDLVEKGILSKNAEGGRSTSYSLVRK